MAGARHASLRDHDPKPIGNAHKIPTLAEAIG
jgi:hypothetical protein